MELFDCAAVALQHVGNMRNLGMLLLIAGCAMAAIGLVLLLAPKVPWLGHLSGDINYRGKNMSFHFPLATGIVVSIVLTVVLNLIVRLFRR